MGLDGTAAAAMAVDIGPGDAATGAVGDATGGQIVAIETESREDAPDKEVTALDVYTLDADARPIARRRVHELTASLDSPPYTDCQSGCSASGRPAPLSLVVLALYLLRRRGA